MTDLHDKEKGKKIEEINKWIKENGSDGISDGYHTFSELYDHRITLFIALCNFIYSEMSPPKIAWKSKTHSDGTSWDGWFVAGIGTEKGEQITYHLPIDRWNELRVVAYDKAPEWDGHTPQDVINRLKSL